MPSPPHVVTCHLQFQACVCLCNAEWAIITHEEGNADLWQADWDDEDAADDFQQKLKVLNCLFARQGWQQA